MLKVRCNAQWYHIEATRLYYKLNNSLCVKSDDAVVVRVDMNNGELPVGRLAKWSPINPLVTKLSLTMGIGFDSSVCRRAVGLTVTGCLGTRQFSRSHR